MQYANNCDILLHHSIVPWALTRLLIYLSQSITQSWSKKERACDSYCSPNFIQTQHPWKGAVGGSVDVTNHLLRRALWVRIARKACCLSFCKMRPDAAEHPGMFGTLHLTYHVLGHTRSFSGMPDTTAAWLLERSKGLIRQNRWKPLLAFKPMTSSASLMHTWCLLAAVS